MKHILTSILIAGATGIAAVPTASAQDYSARELAPTFTGTGINASQERVKSQPATPETSNVRTYPSQAVQCPVCVSQSISIPNFSDIWMTPPESPPPTPPGTPIPYPNSAKVSGNALTLQTTWPVFLGTPPRDE